MGFKADPDNDGWTLADSHGWRPQRRPSCSSVGMQRNTNRHARSLKTHLGGAHSALHRLYVAQVLLDHSALPQQEVAPADERLALAGPEPIARAVLDVFVQLLVRVAHPRVDELRPMLRREVAVALQSRAAHERQRARRADEGRWRDTLEMRRVELEVRCG